MKKLNILLSCIAFAFAFAQTTLAVPKTNPDISVNILLLGKKGLSKTDHEEHGGEPGEMHEGEHEDEHEDHAMHSEEEHSHLADGFSVQEVEVYFKSNIDPYWSGHAYIGLSQHGKEFELELEEVYVESLFIPSFTLKMGKFYAFLGRHNNLHTHYYPFIDAPLINQTLFGFHGWSATGLSLAYLTPLMWYSEIVLQGFYNNEENPLAGILFLKNFWDLNSNSSLELDLAYGSQVNDFEHLFNLAFVFKWQSQKSNNRNSLFWTTEWMKAMGDHTEDADGVSSYVQWEFLRNWWFEGRVDYLSHNNWSDIENQKYSFLVSFAPTEYSAIRLQYDLNKTDHGEWSHGIAIQTNMSLGTHPAHLY